eukprot:SRR837773.2056.p1 GENE.SRR837773.2056~~SRR837773.2056.p1  ORF type:complete len:342 (+),score=46.74 SRR837773.2056:135-1028(+)
MVVARYDEDLQWATKVAARIDERGLAGKVAITVYNKGQPWALPKNYTSRVLRFRTLPNLPEGREGHTFLTHVATHYDSVADTTAFLQGSPATHLPNIEDVLSNYDIGAVHSFSCLSCRWKGPPVNVPPNGCAPDPKPVMYKVDAHTMQVVEPVNYHDDGIDATIQKMSEADDTDPWDVVAAALGSVGISPPEERIPFCYAAQFLVSRENIVALPRSVYHRLLRWMLNPDMTAARSADNGYVLERIWGAIFNKPGLLEQPWQPSVHWRKWERLSVAVAVALALLAAILTARKASPQAC